MSYNGSGTFNINSSGQPVVTGTVISSTAFNALTADLGTGLSTAITKDGQTVATARIPFAAGINSSLVTDSTSTTTGSIITAGGVGIAKALFVGTTLNVAGASTLAAITGTFNGTVGATTPATGAFTTLSATGTLSGGTSGTGYSFSGSAPAGSLTLDASGNLGVATTTPAGKVSILQSASATPALITDVTNAVGSIWQRFTTASSANQYMDIVLRSGNEVEFKTSSKDISLINNTTFLVKSSGNVGIGLSGPTYQLQVNTDSAGKPGVGGLWTVVSDERIKDNIVPANLDRCYEIVKSVPLKHFGFASGVYTDDQIQDKHNLGWIAQDVQKVFKNAVSVKPFTPAIGDVIEDCLDLNSGQMIAALYGCVQALMAKVEALEAK